MKKSLLLSLLAIIGFLTSPAQDYFEKIGKISKEEIDMPNCSFDPTADAVVLFDVGTSGFMKTDDGFDVLYKRITRVKILTEAGKKYADVAIEYYQKGDIDEKVTIIEANTYSVGENGALKKSKLDQSSCYVEKESKNYRLLKFAMPDVKPGSIIEFEYTVASQYFFNLRDWEFQWEIPVLYSRYEVRMIPFYQYTWLLQGRNKLDELETYEDRSGLQQSNYGVTYNENVSKFVLKNVPAFNDEEFIPSKEDYIIKVNFQLSAFFPPSGGKVDIMTTWPELVKNYLKDDKIGKYIKKCRSNSGDVLDPDSLTGKTQMQIFDYIVNYAKNNFKWDSELGQYSNKSVSELQKDKSGNGAAINLWLVGAMQEAGLEAYPVALSTRKHGKILSDYPFDDAFNNMAVLANIDGKSILTDATDPYCLNYRLPIKSMNDKGLVIDKDNMKWISLQSPVISNLTTSIKIDSIGKEFTSTVIQTATEYEALHLRNTYGDDKVELLDNLNKKYNVVDNSLIVKNVLDRTRPLVYGYKTSNKTEVINNKIYIQPFLSEVYSENPLKQKTRTYPVDMTYPVKQTYQSEIIIPEGYTVQFLPDKSSLSDDLFELDYSASQTESRINVVLMYSFKHSIYKPEEYNRVKTLFDRIVKKSTEKIVLVKI